MLAIDIGNSRIKCVQFEGDKCTASYVQAYSPGEIVVALNSLELSFESPVAISNVAGELIKKQLEEWLADNGCSSYFFAETRRNQCGLRNAYLEPGLLGVDRWLAMIAAFNYVFDDHNSPVCVIDCGTALTVDVVDRDGAHQGGLIMPGLSMAKKSLLEGASDIKKSRQEDSNNRLLATETGAAVDSGCQQLIARGVSGVVADLMNEFSGMRVVVTGGDAEWLVARLSCASKLEANLVHHGLRIVSEE